MTNEILEDGKSHFHLMNIIIGTCNFFIRVDPGEIKPNYRVDLIQVNSTLASLQGTSTSSPGARYGTCLA